MVGRTTGQSEHGNESKNVALNALHIRTSSES
jgi:hypothetical protein